MNSFVLSDKNSYNNVPIPSHIRLDAYNTDVFDIFGHNKHPRSGQTEWNTFYYGREHGRKYMYNWLPWMLLRSDLTGVDVGKISAFPDFQVVLELSLFIAFILSKTKSVY